MLQGSQPWAAGWCAALCLIGALAWPARARAGLDSSDGWGRINLDLCSSGCELAATIAFAAPVAGFAVMDVAYGVRGSWLPRGFAYGQLGFAVTSGVFASMGVAGGANVDPRFAALLGVDIAFVVDALFSLWLYDKPRAAAVDTGVHAVLLPMPGGLWTGISRRF